MGVCSERVLQSLIGMADAHLKDVPILTSILNIIQPLIEVTGAKSCEILPNMLSTVVNCCSYDR